MSWGNSWGGGSDGSKSGWGSNTLSSQSAGNKDPEGQHHNQCIAGNIWGNSGHFGSYYDEKCPGCRRDRACSTWSSTSSGGNHVIKIAALLGVAAVAKKSLWD